MSTASDMITTIDAAISAIATKQASSWTLEGVTYTAHDLDKLVRVREHYAQIYAGEIAAASKTPKPRWGITKLSAGDGR